MRDTRLGYTLFDLLAVEAGAIPAWWVTGCLLGGHPTVLFFVVFSVLTLAFGGVLWCFLFLWLLPLIERRRKGRAK